MAHGLVPDSVKMPAPELFTATHDSETVRTFINVNDMYFKLNCISYENTKALFSKTRLSDTARTWYDSQGYDKTMITFSMVKSHMLDYFIPLTMSEGLEEHWLLSKWDRDWSKSM